jgi:membrane protease subunit HflK
MRQRMYLESMQEIFTRASKVMVDTKSNNNMLYLPLDKIMNLAAQDASKSNAGNAGSGLSSQPVQPPLRGSAVPVPQSSGSSTSNTLPRDRTSR